MRLAAWADGLFDLLLPSGCAACGGWIQGREVQRLVCATCRSRLRPAPWPRCDRCHHPRGTGRAPATECRECLMWPAELTFARYAYALEAPASDLVHALKYEGWAELAPEMARPMARLRLPRVAGSPVVVVPVPTTLRRERERGYNQARLLARGLADALDAPLVEALSRSGKRGTQVALHPSQRRANVKGVFAPRGLADRRLCDAHVVLVDDVLTTGATASSAAEVLGGMGVAAVTLVAYARALPLRRPRR